MAIEILWRVLKGWPANYPKTDSWDRPRSPFKAPWYATLGEPNMNGDWAVAALVARSASHPDRGGSDEAFVTVSDAIKTLKAAGVIT
jgi:hypothetical protein